MAGREAAGNLEGKRAEHRQPAAAAASMITTPP